MNRGLCTLAVLVASSWVEATPPPRPEVVPSEMLDGSTLKLPEGELIVLIDAPNSRWEWTHLGDAYFSCQDGTLASGHFSRSLQVWRVSRIPHRAEAQAEFNRRRPKWETWTITSWEGSLLPVTGSIRYTVLHKIGHSEHSLLGYYTPQRFHFLDSDDGTSEAELYRQFVASYRVGARQ